MNQYILLRRLRGPIFLLIFGVTAVLDEYTSIHYGRSWPLYLIVWGILNLAENAILARQPIPPPPAYPGYPPQAGSNYYGSAPPPTGTASNPTSTAIVPSQGEEGR